MTKALTNGLNNFRIPLAEKARNQENVENPRDADALQDPQKVIEESPRQGKPAFLARSPKASFPWNSSQMLLLSAIA